VRVLARVSCRPPWAASSAFQLNPTWRGQACSNVAGELSSAFNSPVPWLGVPPHNRVPDGDAATTCTPPPIRPLSYPGSGGGGVGTGIAVATGRPTPARFLPRSGLAFQALHRAGGLGGGGETS